MRRPSIWRCPVTEGRRRENRLLGECFHSWSGDLDPGKKTVRNASESAQNKMTKGAMIFQADGSHQG